jgi:hypothetical protein
MSWMNEVSDILQQYKNPTTMTPPANAPADFAKVAQSAPSSVLSGGLAEAFRSPNTPPFGQMVSQLFGQSDGGQRAGILNHLIAAAGPAAMSGGLLGNLVSSLSGAGTAVTPQQAQQVPPDTVRQLADQAEKHDPSIIDRAGEFYAQHPKLVQGLGAAALAVAMSHVSQTH